MLDWLFGLDLRPEGESWGWIGGLSALAKFLKGLHLHDGTP